MDRAEWVGLPIRDRDHAINCKVLSHQQPKKQKHSRRKYPVLHQYQSSQENCQFVDNCLALSP